MDLAELTAIVSDVRNEGNDLAEVEVKQASGGFPQSVAPTLSAFGNTPGGGTLLLGLDESDRFASVGVYDVAACKTALANVARQALDPPVTFDVFDFMFEGRPVVAAQIHELPASAKPCKVRAEGKAYLRAYDGDYPLSQVEEQAFLANRDTPTFDKEAVPGTSTSDLDKDLLQAYLSSCRASSSALAAFPDEEVLFRTGVTTGDARALTIAGLLALGVFPQQHLPNFVIQASVAPRRGDPVGTRASDTRRFDGPIPTMLDEALRWVQRNTKTRVRYGPGGQVRDEPEFPVEAVRELLSNALIHRDLGPYARTGAVTLKLDERQLVLSNPGGLWGITVDRLGKDGVTSARNGHLLRICQNVRTREGNRVIEALASGIPTVLRTLSDAGMVPPRFHDQGIRFTVLVPNHALLSPDDLQWLAGLTPQVPLNDQQRHALVAMRHGQTWTNQTLRESFPMDSTEARRALGGLVEAGVAVAEGQRGGRVYRLADALAEQEAGEQHEAESAPSPAGDAKLAPTAGSSAPRRTTAGTRNAEAVLTALRQVGESNVQELMSKTQLSKRQVEYTLLGLRAEGRVELRGSRGVRESRYALLN